MSEARVRISCHGCAGDLDPGAATPFACQATGDGGDHVLRYTVEGAPALPQKGDPNPFIRYRELLAVYQLAIADGIGDAAYVDRAGELDRRVEAVCGTGFRMTPFGFSEALGVLVKDETGNVAGSHKARHLFGIALHLEMREAAGAPRAGRLAIASCGNAALAAAVVAKAARRPLEVFIPAWADAAVVRELRELGAELVVCERAPDDPPGDPCVRRFRAAVAGGAVPFSCQGTDNGLTIDGGKTLGFEIAAQAEAPIARLFVQVGGGALASALWQGLEQAGGPLPSLCPVQAEGGHPLVRALRKIRSAGDLERARRHRGEFMWPWESEPTSAASGILDDETYDWWQIARAVLESGGEAVVASEGDIAEATRRAAAAGFDASATGAAGLAGWIAAGEPTGSAVIMTGVRR